MSSSVATFAPCVRDDLEEEVLWLEVAVPHSDFAHLGNGADHLMNGDRSLNLREMARLDDLVEELAASTKFHDEVIVLLILGVFVELDAVRVVHGLHDANLRLQEINSIHLRLADGLHHADAIGGLVGRLEDRAVEALAQVRLRAVSPPAAVLRLRDGCSRHLSCHDVRP